jgi:hypothetical protein
MKDRPSIQDLWEREQCPIVNGIIFDSGEIVLLKIRSLQVRSIWVELLDVVGKTTLEEILIDHPERLASITTLNETQVDSEGSGLRLFCGEGSLGGDGFVSACRASDSHLNWIAFFDNSNPFEHIEIDGSDALAVNNCQQIWRFPLMRPDLCCVVK